MEYRCQLCGVDSISGSYPLQCFCASRDQNRCQTFADVVFIIVVIAVTVAYCYTISVSASQPPVGKLSQPLSARPSPQKSSIPV